MAKIRTTRKDKPGYRADQLTVFEGMGPGTVVQTQGDCPGIGGPFLVCMEHETEPRRRSGCPNGSTKTFLVDLLHGHRFNLDAFHESTRFYEVDCEMVVN